MQIDRIACICTRHLHVLMLDLMIHLLTKLESTSKMTRRSPYCSHKLIPFNAPSISTMLLVPKQRGITYA